MELQPTKGKQIILKLKTRYSFNVNSSVQVVSRLPALSVEDDLGNEENLLVGFTPPEPLVTFSSLGGAVLGSLETRTSPRNKRNSDQPPFTCDPKRRIVGTRVTYERRTRC